jgi:hypothetical protein
MPLTKFRKENKDLKPWTVYVWEESDIIKGAAQVLAKGINEIYISGRQIDKDDKWKNPNRKKDVYIAKSQVKTDLQNTLNAINWYGMEIMDSKGINEEKFIKKELKSATSSAGIYKDISHILPVKKYPVKNITINQAQELGLT